VKRRWLLILGATLGTVVIGAALIVVITVRSGSTHPEHRGLVSPYYVPCVAHTCDVATQSSRPNIIVCPGRKYSCPSPLSDPLPLPIHIASNSNSHDLGVTSCVLSARRSDKTSVSASGAYMTNQEPATPEPASKSGSYYLTVKVFDQIGSAIGVGHRLVSFGEINAEDLWQIDVNVDVPSNSDPGGIYCVAGLFDQGDAQPDL
jgi:hypothetical protein